MTYKKYNVADNSYWILWGDITSTDTTIPLSESYNLPSSNYVVSLIHTNSDWQIEKQEKVYVSSTNGSNLTVQRWYDWTTAQSFSTGDSVQLLIEQEIIRDLQRWIDTKANLSWGNNFTGDQTIDWTITITEQSNAPWTPVSWSWVVYEKNDWILYFKNDDWTEYDLTGGWWSWDMLKSTYDTDNDWVVDNAKKLDWKTVTTTLGNDDSTIPTSKAVQDAIGNSGGWDMLKSTYDTDDNWVVDNAEKIDWKTVATTLWTDDTTIPTGKAVNDALSWYLDKNTYDNDNDWVVDNAKQVDWKSITTTLWTDDTTVPTSKAVKDYVDSNSWWWWWTITTLDILEVPWTQSTGVVSSYRTPQGWTLAKFSAYLETAPDWADFKVDIKINWTTQATADIIVWTNSWTTTTFTNTTLAEWDLITYEITQVGFFTAGADLTLWLNLA